MLLKRRKDKRFQVRASAFTTLGPHFTVMGEITDISKSGLSFCYVRGKQPSKLAAVSDTFLHIFSSDMSFCLLGVPINPVSDFEISHRIFFTPMWRRGVKFGNMTEDQKSQLAYFIKKYTTDEVEESRNPANWKKWKRYCKTASAMTPEGSRKNNLADTTVLS